MTAMGTDSWSLTATAFTRHLLTTGKSSQTVRTYVNALSLFWRWCEAIEECPSSADKDTVRAWLLHRSETVSATKVHSNLAGLNSYYQYLVDEGVRTDHPSKALKWKRGESMPTAPLDQPDVLALFRACDQERDRLFILLLVYSGVRITEFASMTGEDIDWHQGTITIKHGKGDVARQVQPAAEVMARLRSYLGLFPQGPLWRSLRDHNPMTAHQIRKRIYHITAKAGLSHIHPHRFRSTFACEFLDQFDGDIHALKGAMGHKDISTTARYAKAAELRRGLAKMQRFNLPGLTA
jgi:site-specific recombinase XerD